MDTLLTAEIAANAPRYRRKSSTFIDGIHDVSSEGHMAPAQLYSTMSGRLFHSGRIAIVMVGLPARGKTHICVSLARYLQWLGIKTRIFHLGDYRRATVGVGGEVPQDYFFPNASPASVMLRQKILKKCREDIYAWLNHENGQVAIYDAVNPTSSGRRSLAKEFAKHDVQTLFLESYVNDQAILQENARNVKISSPDFYGMDPDEAAKRYLKRIETKIPVFESMDEPELNFIKMINAGQSFSYNDVSFNYVSHRIVFYLMNLHLKSRTTYFVRAGTTTANMLATALGGGGSASALIDADDDVATSYLPGSSTSHRGDAPLSEEGKLYGEKMTDALLRHREQERRAAAELSGNPDLPLRNLAVWTSTRTRTAETAEPLRRRGYRVLQRSQMAQISLGVCERLTVQAIRHLYPAEVEKHEKDPYHHRYPRAESYHDLAVRLEPIILELEREQSDLLIIAHESVLRVLYAYLMHCSTMDIPKLKFPRDEIIEIIPAAYQNEFKRIHIPGLDPTMVPGSPETFRGGVGGGGGVGTTAGTPHMVGGGASVATPMSPIPSLSTPVLTMEQMQDPLEILGPAAMSPLGGQGMPSPLPGADVGASGKEMVADKVDDED